MCGTDGAHEPVVGDPRRWGARPTHARVSGREVAVMGQKSARFVRSFRQWRGRTRSRGKATATRPRLDRPGLAPGRTTRRGVVGRPGELVRRCRTKSTRCTTTTARCRSTQQGAVRLDVQEVLLTDLLRPDPRQPVVGRDQVLTRRCPCPGPGHRPHRGWCLPCRGGGRRCRDRGGAPGVAVRALRGHAHPGYRWGARQRTRARDHGCAGAGAHRGDGGISGPARCRSRDPGRHRYDAGRR